MTAPATELIELVRPMRLANGEEAAAGAVLELPRADAAAAVHNRKAVYCTAAAAAAEPAPAPGPEADPEPVPV